MRSAWGDARKCGGAQVADEDPRRIFESGSCEMRSASRGVERTVQPEMIGSGWTTEDKGGRTWSEDKSMAFYGAYDVEKEVYDILGGSRRPWPPFSERQGLRIIVVDA